MNAARAAAWASVSASESAAAAGTAGAGSTRTGAGTVGAGGLSIMGAAGWTGSGAGAAAPMMDNRSEEHTSELQSPDHILFRLLLEKKKKLILHNRLRDT